MKTNILVILLLAVSSIVALAQDEEAKASGPAIQFENLEHDFGEIEKTDPVSTVFKFKNTGTETLKIISVKPSCGCTSATPDKKEYAPNESGSIPVTFNPSRFSGNIVKRVTVTTNDAENPKQHLTIRGRIVQDIYMRPATLYFPKVRRNDQVSREISVTTERLDKLEITNLSLNPDFMKGEIEQVDDKQVKIKVTVDATKIPKDQKRATGTLTFDTNSETSQKNMRTGVTVNLQDPITVKPRSTVYFFGTKLGQKRETVVTLVSNDGKDIQLESAETDLDFVNVELMPNEKTRQSLKVTLLDTAKKGRFNGKITVKTNLSEQSEVVIPIRGMVN